MGEFVHPMSQRDIHGQEPEIAHDEDLGQPAPHVRTIGCTDLHQFPARRAAATSSISIFMSSNS